MKWLIKNKESIIKKKFALFPKRIGQYRLWLHHYYETHDYIYQGAYSGYIPHWFISKYDAIEYVKSKKGIDTIYFK